MSWKTLLNPWGEIKKLKENLLLAQENASFLQKKHTEDRRIRTMINFPVGTHVFAVYNHPSELFEGEVIGYEAITQSQTLVCKVLGHQGEVRTCLSVHKANPDILRVLRALPWWERYNVVNHWSYITQEQAATLELYGTFSPDLDAEPMAEWPENWKDYTGERASNQITPGPYSRPLL